jgi:4-oxalocrotonate tautomerase
MPSINLQSSRDEPRTESCGRPRVHGNPGSGTRQTAEHTYIVIQEIDEEDWGFAGVLTNDFQTYNGNRGGGLPS